MHAVSVRSWLATILVVMVLAVVTGGAVRAQGIDDLEVLNAQVAKLYGQGKYAEATEIAKRSLALAEEKFGPDHPSIAPSLNYLAERTRARAAPPMPSRCTSAHSASGRRRWGPNTQTSAAC